jgi:hypothetical protein
MTTRGRLARLERLERLKRTNEPDHSCPGFVIVPEIARAIRDEYNRLHELLWRWELLPFPFGEKPDPKAEEEAAARLAEFVRNIDCPTDYWAKQADTDRRLSDINQKPPLSNDALAQVEARLIVFDGSPDGAAWRRMMDLSYRTRSLDEQAELDELQRRYPGMPLKHYDLMYEIARELEDKGRNLATDPLKRTKPFESCWHRTANALWKRVQPYRC